ncbi:hypothetical protein HPB50_007648 [Hyalomma asiaticum]|uniref:Uncharacterized protein n=1 Tax=Hyalomma asiaticum TaxID=266040 RepID=A0ACB7RKU2_HYAAI|nr:hypothetical protein HPB50_007648 [Hyalomma asiaticum]
MADRNLFFTRLVGAMQSAGCYVVPRYVDAGNALCVTLLVIDEAHRPAEYRPICFCAWHRLPFVAVHSEGMSVHDVTSSPRLSVPLGDIASCLRGTFNNLTCAKEAAVREYTEPRGQP